MMSSLIIKQIIKDINNLFEHIYFIGITISISRNTVDEISIGINKNIENWDKNILIIIHKLNEYINLYKNNQIKIPTDQYIIDALTIFDSHIKNPEKANIFIAIDSLINPLVNLRHKYIKDLRVFEIQEYLTECSIAHREINKLKELYGRMYSNFIDEIDSTKNDIIQITSRIDPF